MSVNDTIHSDSSTWNRQAYQRIKVALSLGLRRQIFLAVCDDLNLRNQVAARLHSNLAYPVGQVLFHPSSYQESSTPAYPKLVTLRLNLAEPNLINQINSWLANYPPPTVAGSKDSPGKSLPIPAFQIVGIEQLTRQPVATQRLFLHNLKLIEQNLSNQESSLLLWVSRPWLYAIQQSAPQFWRCRTGTFTFAGEPTPMSLNQGSPERFPDDQNLEVENLEQSILEKSVLEESVLEESVELAKEDFDFQIESPDSSSHSSQDKFLNDDESLISTQNKSTQNQQESVTSISSSSTFGINRSAQPQSSISHVNQELSELVIATINSQFYEDGEQNPPAQQLLLEIEDLHKQKASNQTLAISYQHLGNLYRQRIEEGDSTLENLMIAILAYQESITYDDISPQVPDVLNDLGTLYWMLYRTPPNSEEGQSYIEQGIEFYLLALNMISSDMPDNSDSEDIKVSTYARVQNNLGTAYGDLARFSNPAENWQKAVLAYREALRFRTVEMEPLKYAACQNNLGTAYWHLAQYNQPVEHLKRAIAAYKLALVHYNPEFEALKYGMIQNNIGTAYWNLAQYERPGENLQLAINAYDEALKYRTPANLPVACAATQNNLGTAYWHLANQPETDKELRQEYLQLCIEAYEEALALAHSLKGVSLSFDIFVTHNNLGLAHYQIVTDKYFEGDKTERSQHLEASLDNHLQALNGLSKQPEAYQSTLVYVIKTIRGFHNELGLQGQNLALSKVPGQLLPEILPKL